jgi:hypothetical protein
MGWAISDTLRPRLSPGERTPGTHWTGGWVGPRAGLDSDVRGKFLLPLPGNEPVSPGTPVRSQTLHWLSYPAPTCNYYFIVFIYLFLVNLCTEHAMKRKLKTTVTNSLTYTCNEIKCWTNVWRSQHETVLVTDKGAETKCSFCQVLFS